MFHVTWYEHSIQVYIQSTYLSSPLLSFPLILSYLSSPLLVPASSQVVVSPPWVMLRSG